MGAKFCFSLKKNENNSSEDGQIGSETITQASTESEIRKKFCQCAANFNIQNEVDVQQLRNFYALYLLKMCDECGGKRHEKQKQKLHELH